MGGVSTSGFTFICLSIYLSTYDKNYLAETIAGFMTFPLFYISDISKHQRGSELGFKGTEKGSDYHPGPLVRYVNLSVEMFSDQNTAYTVQA